MQATPLNQFTPPRDEDVDAVAQTHVSTINGVLASFYKGGAFDFCVSDATIQNCALPHEMRKKRP